MKQPEFIKLVDLLSFIALVLMVSTGLLIEITLPTRSGPASVLSLTRHEWGTAHLYISLIFLLLMACHLFLHVRFIKFAILGRASREHTYRVAIGVIGLLALLCLAVLPFFAPVENVRDVDSRPRQHQRDR